MAEDRSKRAYNSPVRSRQKAETRRTIVDAAATEFAMHGFAGATMRSIAERAKVSSESVHLVGQKRTLLVEALEQMTNATVPELASDRELEQALSAGAHDLVVERLVDLHSRWSEQSSRLWLVATTEAFGDEEARQHVNLARAQRRADWQWLVGYLPDASPHLALSLEVTTSPETYLQIGTDYSPWLRHQLEVSLGQA